MYLAVVGEVAKSVGACEVSRRSLTCLCMILGRKEWSLVEKQKMAVRLIAIVSSARRLTHVCSHYVTVIQGELLKGKTVYEVDGS